MMELEHWLWVGVSFAVSLFLVWLVWNFCCGDRKGKGEAEDKSDDSDSFSSTRVITRSHPRKVRRKRRSSKRRNESSAAETTTDDDSASEESGGSGSRRGPPRRKSRRGRSSSSKPINSSSYSYKENNYGLHDPFSEWTPKVTPYRDPVLPIVHNYPKSPSVPRKTSQTTINLET